MTGYLRQSTAITISVGPFIDKDDGNTEKIGLTVQDTDIYISKNGGAKANPNDLNDCVEDANGIYTKQLDDIDTNTLGILTVYIHFTDCLYLRQDFIIVKANWFDTMFSTDYLEVDALQISGAAPNDISVADIIAGITDGSLDLQEILRIIFAAISGKTSGGGTSTLKFRNSADSKNRITATVDENNNRINIVLDGS